jgi:hypothetical protein
VGFAALAACAGPRSALHDGPRPDALGERIAERAASLVGHEGAFSVDGDHFPADCSGFVQAVYASEGVPLRRLMVRAAPHESSGAAAAHRAALEFGVVFGGGGEWPRPGDLVFWHDTYDRDRDGRRDDRFTHVGIVESVERGTVTFIHRGSQAVVRGTMTPGRPHERSDGERELNSYLRAKRRAQPGTPLLAGELFAGYARFPPGAAGGP